MSSVNRGECVNTGGLYRPTHLCVAHFELHKTFQIFFCDVVSLFFLGGGGVMVHVSGGRGLCGVSERGGVIFFSSGLSQAGGKSCLAVWRSGLWSLMVRAGRDCGRDGWGPLQYYLLCWRIVQGKCPGWRGEGHRWSLQLCSLSAGGSCGLLHYSSRTRQWYSWSASSQRFPCRKWWGWVEGDLLFSTGGESVGECCSFLESDVVKKLQ